MTSQNVYALNKVSGVVSVVDRDLISHPTFGEHLVEVQDPDACIECGEQPEQVTTVDGEVIDTSTSEPKAEPEADEETSPKPRNTKRGQK